jgi:4-hydroxythreonine-4-phosphate dehydrogenase
MKSTNSCHFGWKEKEVNHTSKSTSKPDFGKIRIGITQGDIQGIGPEIIAAAIRHYSEDTTVELSIICTEEGKAEILKWTGSDLSLSNIKIIEPDINSTDAGLADSPELICVYLGAVLAMNKQIDALVTGPVNKHKVAEKFPGFTGHTPFLKDLCKVKDRDVLMLMASPTLKVAVLTEHVPIREVSARLSKEKIINAGLLLHDYMSTIIEKPAIGILGLNPHAGDDGLVGNEEKEIIIPAIEDLKKLEVNVFGPIPGDTAFIPEARERYNAILAMYHDQGLIPVKMRGLDNVVNITLGLPIIRTSPAHGVAYDIAGKGTASAKSLLRAIDEASTQVLTRRFTNEQQAHIC